MHFIETHFLPLFALCAVSLQGKKVIPQTLQTLTLLRERNIPFILLTNGGGMTESEKADQLTERIGFKISSDQLVLSHSPMQDLVPTYGDKNVLVVGGPHSHCKVVAESYGFKHVVTPEEIHHVDPSSCPFSNCETRPASPKERRLIGDIERPVDAIMLFHDSEDWGRDLQIMTDALVSKNGKLGTIKDPVELANSLQSVPLYCSNPDIEWSAEYPLPRFAQGTFRVCLERIYKERTGQKLTYTMYGKPLATTYRYAEKMLDRLAPLPDGIKRRVYAIGDNPSADIQGANNYGWKSVLVRTGVFRPVGDENHTIYPATKVEDNVGDAVKWILEQEGMKV